MNQKKELSAKNYTMTVASIILNDEDESQKLLNITTLMNEQTLDISAKLSLFSGKSCLHLAVEKNLLQIVRLLIDSGANINARSWNGLTPAHSAAKGGLDSMLIMFHNADLNVRGGKKLETPLHIVVRKNFPRCVDVLRSFANPVDYSVKNIENMTAVDLMKNYDNLATRYALERALFFPSYLNALNMALVNKNWQDVYQYIMTGLPVSVTYANQRSAIIEAADHGLAEILLLLCQQPEIDMNATDKDGNTALHLSIKKSVDCVMILVACSKPINRNYRNKKGQTAEDLLAEISDENERLKFREALVHLPAKKRSPDYEINFFSNERQITAPVKPIDLFASNLKYLELNKLDHLKLPDNKKNITDCKNRVSDSDEQWYLLNIAKVAKSGFSKLIELDEKKLHKLLIIYGLDKSYPESEVVCLSKKDFQYITGEAAGEVPAEMSINMKCLHPIYSLCMGVRNNNRLEIDIHTIFLKSLGLLSLYKPVEIIEGLMLLSSRFCNHQHLIGNLLVKNIIISSIEFGLDLSGEPFVKTMQLYLKKYCLNDISNTLATMLERVNQLQVNPSYVAYINALAAPRNDGYVEDIADKIQGIINKKDPLKQEDCRYIAREMSNFTIDFYQKFWLKLFNDNSNKIDLNDSYTALKQQFNLLAFFIEHTILQQTTARERARAIMLFAMVAKECLHLGTGPDFNSLAFIMSVISAPVICRLKNSFALIDKKTSKLIDALTSISDCSWNYKLLRTLTKDYPGSLPYVGLIFKDIIMMGESNNLVDDLDILGEIYRPLLLLKRRVEFVKITFKSDLPLQLKRFASFDDNRFRKMSCLYEPEMLVLSDTLKLETFVEMLNKIKSNNYPLMVVRESKCFQENKALEAILIWLKIMVKSGQVDSVTSEEIYNDCKSYITDFRKENYMKKIEHTNSKFRFFVDDVAPVLLKNKDDIMEFSTK